MNRVGQAMKRGQKLGIGELITTAVEYERAGEDRRDLAQKIINAQIALAKSGRSAGGRAPYGLRRCLVRDDGTHGPYVGGRGARPHQGATRYVGPGAGCGVQHAAPHFGDARAHAGNARRPDTHGRGRSPLRTLAVPARMVGFGTEPAAFGTRPRLSPSPATRSTWR